MDNHKIHYLACGQLKELLVRKKGSAHFRPLNPGIVEIGPTGCSFEWEGGQEFQPRDELEFLFHLEECSLNAEATVVSVDCWSCWDDGYDHKTWYSYRAEFSDELDAGMFQQLVSCAKRCRP